MTWSCACSTEEALQALSAALEVNEHLRQQVEEKGNLVQSMTAQIQAYEHRYNELKSRVRELEMQQTEEAVAGKASDTVRRHVTRCYVLVMWFSSSSPSNGNLTRFFQ